MKLTRREFAAGIAAGIAAPGIMTSARAQAGTIKIGMCAPVTGPAAESGGYAIKGAKLALDAVNKAGGILGKQAELIIEDDQTTNPGIVLATAGGKALTEALTKLGAPPVLDQGYANQSQDFTPVVLAIKQSGADVLGSYFTFENDLGIFARQLRQLGVNIPWVGSPSIVNITALKLAGPALYNTFGVADYAEDSSDASKAYGKLYRDAAKVAPDNQSSWTFDAVTVLSASINKAGSTDPAKIREAILATKKFPGAEGEYNFDQNGDGLHGYNIVKNDKGTISFDKHIEFTD
jgi:ABC-type branched-subunit amino acid transport system substrate-binding protein